MPRLLARVAEGRSAPAARIKHLRAVRGVHAQRQDRAHQRIGRRGRGREVARRLADEAHEQRMDGEIVPLAVERRGEHQQAASADATLDEERPAILEADQRRVVGLRLDGHVTEEAHTAPALRVA